MNKIKEEFHLIKTRYSIYELLKALATGAVFFLFPTLLMVGLLIVFGTVYPYWNMNFLIIGSVLAFLYGIWTNQIVIQTLSEYHKNNPKELILFALLMQILLFIAIIIVDIIVITTIF